MTPEHRYNLVGGRGLGSWRGKEPVSGLGREPGRGLGREPGRGLGREPGRRPDKRPGRGRWRWQVSGP